MNKIKIGNNGILVTKRHYFQCQLSWQTKQWIKTHMEKHCHIRNYVLATRIDEHLYLQNTITTNYGHQWTLWFGCSCALFLYHSMYTATQTIQEILIVEFQNLISRHSQLSRTCIQRTHSEIHAWGKQGPYHSGTRKKIELEQLIIFFLPSSQSRGIRFSSEPCMFIICSSTHLTDSSFMYHVTVPANTKSEEAYWYRHKYIYS